MSTKANREMCASYIKKHLAECAEEVLEWHMKSVLRDGKVRELAGMVAEWAGNSHALTIAENMVGGEALRFAAQHAGAEVLKLEVK